MRWASESSPAARGCRPGRCGSTTSWVCWRRRGWTRTLATASTSPASSRQARLIASLRQLHFPLAEIKAILPLEPAQAAERVRQFWAATESKHSSLRALATYLIDELSGKRSVVYEVKTREIPERSLLCVKRNVTGEKAAWAFGKEFIALLRHYKFPQVEGRAGAFFQYLLG